MRIRRVRLAALCLAAIALTIGTFAWLWPRPPRPPDPTVSSLLGTWEHDKNQLDSWLRFNALYSLPDPGAFLLLLESEIGTLEVCPNLEVRTARGKVGTLSPALLQQLLGLPATPQGDRFAADLDTQVRYVMTHPLSPDGYATGIRRWKDSETHDPDLWYETETGLALYACSAAKRPKTLIHSGK